MISNYLDYHEAGSPIWEAGGINLYSIAIFVGIILSVATIAFFWHRQKYSWEVLQIMVIVIVPSSIFGARLWYVIVEGGWSNFWVFEGLAIQGGITGGSLAGFGYAWLRRDVIDLRTAWGIFIPAILIGQVIGRWGNFSNHEVYGQIVDEDSLNWLPAFIRDNMYIRGPVIDGITEPTAAYRAPLFLYESMANLLGYILIVWVALYFNRFKPGTTAGMYFLWYGVVRAIMEPLRDESNIMSFNTVPVSLVLAIVMIVFGVVQIIVFQLGATPYSKFERKMIPTSFKESFRKEYVLIKPVKWTRSLYTFFVKMEREYWIWVPKNSIKEEEMKIVENIIAEEKQEAKVVSTPQGE